MVPKLEISFHAKITLAQGLPDDMEEKVVQFHLFVIAARQRVYPLSCIFNMDDTDAVQTPLPAFPRVPWQPNTCGAEKRSFTVAAGWTKLPPKVMFKAVWTRRDLIESGMKEWFTSVCQEPIITNSHCQCGTPSEPGCKESCVQQPGASGFCDRASEFCA